MSIINSSFKKLGSFLQDDIYYIPEYQRGYSWEEDQLDDYWQDLIQLHNEDEISNHFLGQIVVHYNTELKQKYIIDGQQRTSSSVILLDVFRRFFDEFDTDDSKIESSDITTKFIGRNTAIKNDIKLILGENDRHFFRTYIQSLDRNDINKKNLTKSELRIYEANQYFMKELKKFVSEYKSTEQQFVATYHLYKTFIEHFTVMYVETDDINEAFIIFETLNARGKELETSDLLKNHVFRVANHKLPIIQEDWNIMLENLGKIDPTKFIRHYWNSNNNFVREKDLYKSLRKKVLSTKDAQDLVKELANLSKLYSALNTPDETTYFNEHSLNEKIKEINYLGAVSYYPIILALEKQNFEEKDILDILRAIETLVVRNFVVAGRVANRYELEFAKIAHNISKYELKTKEDILTEIRKQTINDNDFKAAFSHFIVKKKPVVRYLYRAMNSHINKETRIIDDNTKIHIEHIMPQKPGNWDVIKEDHEEYLFKFGNQTLLGDEYNKNATNKKFEDKKEIYKKSQIPLTRDIAEFNIWDIEQIENRQESLADIALKIWKR